MTKFTSTRHKPFVFIAGIAFILLLGVCLVAFYNGTEMRSSAANITQCQTAKKINNILTCPFAFLLNGNLCCRKRTPAITNNPTGIFALKEEKEESDGEFFSSVFDPKIFQNPFITGVSLRIAWNTIEPKKNEYDWSRIDEVFRLARENSKKVSLIIVPGFDSPEWAVRNVHTAPFAKKYGKGSDTIQQLPIPWDQTYLDRWFAFLEKVSSRYGKNPVFVMIAAAGPTSVSAEMSLPNTDKDLKAWISLGYTPDKYIAAWAQTFARYAQLFPDQAVSLALYPGLPIDNNGSIDQTKRTETRQRVIDEGLKYPKQFALQTSGLNASRDNQGDTGGYAIVTSYSGTITTGFQLSTSATRNPIKMGDADNPVNALQRSVNKGLERKKNGNKINYLQIYEPDIINKDMQDVLRLTQQQLISKD